MNWKMILFVLLILSNSVFAAEPLDPRQVVPEIVALGIDVQIDRRVDPRFSQLSYDEDKYYLDIQLGRLTRAQYDAIRAQFKNLSRVAYSAEKNYDLVDFLPPSMQAVANKTFDPLEYPESESATQVLEGLFNKLEKEEGNDIVSVWALQKNGLSTCANCWNTSIEVLNSILNGSREYRLFLPGRWEADDALRNNPAETNIDEALIQPFDLITFSVTPLMSDSDLSGGMLQHSAVALNANLVFEKTDSSAADPYRIALRRDVIAKYQALLEKPLIEYIRFPQGTHLLELNDQEFESSDLKNALSVLAPGVKPTDVEAGCENGLGGGCDLYYQVIGRLTVEIDSQTGRGKLTGDPKILKRFSTLKGVAGCMGAIGA